MTFAPDPRTQQVGPILRASMSVREIVCPEEPVLPPWISGWELVYIGVRLQNCNKSGSLPIKMIVFSKTKSKIENTFLFPGIARMPEVIVVLDS